MLTQRELTVANWHRLKRLLAEALKLEAPVRTAWLAALPDEVRDLKALGMSPRGIDMAEVEYWFG